MDSKRVSQGEPPAEGKGNDCLSLGKECNPGEAGQLDFSGTSGLCPDNPEKAPTMCQAQWQACVEESKFIVFYYFFCLYLFAGDSLKETQAFSPPNSTTRLYM